MKYRCPNCGQRNDECFDGLCIQSGLVLWGIEEDGRPQGVDKARWLDYQSGDRGGALFYMVNGEQNPYWTRE